MTAHACLKAWRSVGVGDHLVWNPSQLPVKPVLATNRCRETGSTDQVGNSAAEGHGTNFAREHPPSPSSSYQERASGRRSLERGHAAAVHGKSLGPARLV